MHTRRGTIESPADPRPLSGCWKRPICWDPSSGRVPRAPGTHRDDGCGAATYAL